MAYDTPSLAFRCTIIAEQNLALHGFAAASYNRSVPTLRLYPLPSQTMDTASRFFDSIRVWLPRAHGMYAEGRGGSRLTVLDSGLVEIVGMSTPSFGNTENKHFPGWFAVDVAKLMVFAESLRVRAAKSSSSLVIECEFWHDGTAMSTRGGSWASDQVIVSTSDVTIGAFEISGRDQFASAFSKIEAEIWYGLGQPRFTSLPIDFDKTIANYLGAV